MGCDWWCRIIGEYNYRLLKARRCDVFSSTDDVLGSKMAREMLCFTMETAAVGCEGRICETAVAGYVRATSALCSRYVRASVEVVHTGTVMQSTCNGKQYAAYYWGMQLQIARRLITVVSRWSWVAIGGAVLLGNAIADC